MAFEESLRVDLMTIPELVNKVFPLVAPEGVKTPYVVYVSSEGLEDRTLQGYQASKVVDCELHITSDSYGAMKDLTKKVLTKVKSNLNLSYDRPVELYNNEVQLYRTVLEITVRI